MIDQNDRTDAQAVASRPNSDFTHRLTSSLDRADEQRRRHERFTRFGRMVPFVLLAAPIAASRLISASGGGLHVLVDALVRAAFAVDIGVHVNTAILTYLDLQPLPSIVGLLLLVLVPGWLLSTPRPRR